jgi:hypothetical protein
VLLLLLLLLLLLVVSSVESELPVLHCAWTV